MSDILKTELETYASLRDDLLATSENKFALIHGHDLLGVFESEQDAINQGYQVLGNVPFLVKQIVRVEVTQKFVSHLLAL
jgi:hypothetical protein